MNSRNVQLRLSLGHTDIEGNQKADQLAKAEAKKRPKDPKFRPTAAGRKMEAKRKLKRQAELW